MSDAQYKLVDGALVPLTQDELDQIAADAAIPPRPVPVSRDANVRIDTAMQMLAEALPEPQTDQPDMIRRMDESQLADYVAGLSTAIHDMLVGFRGRMPRAETPQTPPSEPEPKHARGRTRKR